MQSSWLSRGGGLVLGAAKFINLSACQPAELRSPTLASSTQVAPTQEKSVIADTEEVSPAWEQATTVINGDSMRGHVAILTRDAFEGHGLATKGGELAMQYLEQQLRTLGYAPGNPHGAYRQAFDVGGDFVDRSAGWGKQQLEDFEANRYHQPSDELEATRKAARAAAGAH
jgi:hypothetical protein